MYLRLIAMCPAVELLSPKVGVDLAEDGSLLRLRSHGFQAAPQPAAHRQILLFKPGYSEKEKTKFTREELFFRHTVCPKK